MELETKAQISKITLSLLVLVVSAFTLGVLVLFLCAGLGINPFQEATTGFLISGFLGLIGISAVLLLLNVAANLSLIADSKISKLKDMEPHSGKGAVKKWLVTMCILSLLLIGMVFVGAYSSKDRYLQIVRAQADEILRENDNLLDEIGVLLQSTKKEDYKKISGIIEFLQKQRNGLPNVQVIYSGTFSGKPALYGIGSYFQNYGGYDNDYNKIYYSCDKSVDCDYLKKFFSGEKVEVLQKYIMRNGKFYIYIPIDNKNSKFVILFSKNNGYGKIGS